MFQILKVTDRDGRLLRAKELLQAKLASKDEELEAAQVWLRVWVCASVCAYFCMFVCVRVPFSFFLAETVVEVVVAEITRARQW